MSPQPGDVINTRPPERSTWWKILHPKESIPAWGIQRYQRAEGFGEWRDTHSMLFLDETHILSVTYPHTIWDTWEAVQQRLWTVYRPNFELDAQDLAAMRVAADAMIGRHYDVGQLLDIALNKILGYDVSVYRRFFDAGAKLMVCSVGVRTCFDYARKAKEGEGLPPPFEVLFEKDGKKLNVERTCPANYANTPGMFVRRALRS
jgi:hypothetical protein